MKWNHKNRSLVFTTILDKFGPHSSWGRQDYPENKKEEYEQTLADLSVQLTAMTGKTIEWTAVRQQVRWATSNQKKIKDVSYARTYVMNKAVAIEVGFVSYRSLSGTVLGS